MTIRAKLLGILGFLAIFAVIQAGIALYSLRNVSFELQELSTNWLPSVDVSRALEGELNEMQAILAEHILTTSDAEIAALDRQVEQNDKDFAKNRSVYEKLISSAEERQLYDRFSGAYEAYLSTRATLLDLSRRNKNAEALELFKQKLVPAYKSTINPLEQIVSINKTGADGSRKTAEQAASLMKILLTTGSVLLFSLLLSALVFVARAVVRPIKAMTDAMKQLANGEMEHNIPFTERPDEIGEMAGAVEVFRANMMRNATLEVESRELAKRREQRTELMNKAIVAFEAQATQVVRLVTDSASELASAAQSLAANAEETGQQSGIVTSAAREATQTVLSISSASEELSASISDLAERVEDCRSIAKDTASTAAQTDGHVALLSDSAAKIGNIVSIIGDIASKTNLLALNATIEAARAGEAGRGFAVVASEVKDLALQTVRATDEIGQSVRDIQEATNVASGAMADIRGKITDLHEIAQTMAAGAEQQRGATLEIAQNVQMAARGNEQVSLNIEGVSSAAMSTGAMTAQIAGSASELARQSDQLRSAINSFLSEIRAA